MPSPMLIAGLNSSTASHPFVLRAWYNVLGAPSTQNPPSKFVQGSDTEGDAELAEIAGMLDCLRAAPPARLASHTRQILISARPGSWSVFVRTLSVAADPQGLCYRSLC